MRTGHQISTAFQGRHGWQGNDYIDAEGYKYENWARNSSGCSECMFVVPYGHRDDADEPARSGPCCLIFDEKGMSRRDQGRRTGFELKSPRDCNYYFKRDFSEGDSEDEKIRSEVENIAESHGFKAISRPSFTTSESKKSGGKWIWIFLGLGLLYLIFR